MAPSATDVLRLLRIHTGAATASIPALVLFICGGGPLPVVLAFIAGLLHHAWGFSLNEILDLDVDRRADHLSDKPLVSGRIGTGTAWTISFSALLLSFASMIAAAIFSHGSVMFAIGLLFASTVCGTIYDIWSKKVPFMDLFIGAWFALLILSAAAAAGVPQDLRGIVVLIAAASGIHIVFNNMVEGGLKDVRTDRDAGVRSAAVVLGVRSEGGIIISPNGFVALALALGGAFIIGLVMIAAISYTKGAHEAILIVVTVGGTALFGHSMRFLKKDVRMARPALLRTFSMHEIASYTLSILAISYVAGIPASILAIIVPILWFALFNQFMYSRTFTPKV